MNSNLRLRSSRRSARFELSPRGNNSRELRYVFICSLTVCPYERCVFQDEIERLAGVAADSDAAQLDARAETERLRLALASATAEHARLRETNGTFDGLIAGLKAEVLAAEKKAEEGAFIFLFTYGQLD